MSLLGKTTCKCRPILIGMLVNTTRITFKVPEADCPQILTVTDDEDCQKRSHGKALQRKPPFHPYPHVSCAGEAILLITLIIIFKGSLLH